ncbi:phage tail protein [Sphingomonas desiccabilis]|uniref:Tail fiber protein n=1 Tax=Sphingomonas desiccabilis TaxID=429134 RepID=A0A4Q2IZN0_9SPHN|nr:phage tail protein [Sphingomonas desiccabilis]MBB3910151.1 microcystin-dependent protein [Sphingomonas desiccabilis]RXZ34830.1 hypothetical protein EO081_04000 [Sphingomonas desiccabilis]
MSLETAQYLHQLNPANPSGADRLKEGDDHIRMLKAVLKATFPGITGPLSTSVTHTFLNGLAGLLVPVGAIVLWHGAPADVPKGWAICNGDKAAKSDGTGTITTPDLRNRVPVGASADHELLSTFGQTSATYTSSVAGSHTHTGTAAEAGSHSHSGKTGDHSLTTAEMPAHSHMVAAPGTATSLLSNSNTLATGKQDGSDSNYTLTGRSESASYGKTSDGGEGKAHSHPITADGAHTHSLTVSQVDGHSHTVTVDATQPSIALHFIIKV